LILIVLGVASYQLTGRTSLTAMIPAFFGVVLLVCAFVARSSEAARKHAMHAAVAVGLLGGARRRCRAAGGDVAAGDGRVAADLRRARRAVVHCRPKSKDWEILRSHELVIW